MIVWFSVALSIPRSPVQSTSTIQDDKSRSREEGEYRAPTDDTTGYRVVLQQRLEVFRDRHWLDSENACPSGVALGDPSEDVARYHGHEPHNLSAIFLPVGPADTELQHPPVRGQVFEKIALAENVDPLKMAERQFVLKESISSARGSFLRPRPMSDYGS